MGHDASIVGWPWVAGTHSWVEPTAMALLAIAREGQTKPPDGRPKGFACWSTGRSPKEAGTWAIPVVFRHAISGRSPVRPAWPSWPWPGSASRSKVVESAIAYLKVALAETLAPISLGWGMLGLRAWGAAPPESENWLASAFDKAARARAFHAVELAL